MFAQRPDAASERPIVLRSGSGTAALIMVSVLGAILLVDAIVRGRPLLAAVSLPWLFFAVWIIYLLMWRPSIRLTPNGVDVINVGVITHIPWRLLESVDGRLLVVFTVVGGRRIQSWGAPAGPRANLHDMRGRAARQQDARSGAASEYVAIPRGPVAIITAYWQAHRSAAEVAPGAGSGPGSAQVAQGVTRRVDSWPLILGAVIVLVGLASILA